MAANALTGSPAGKGGKGKGLQARIGGVPVWLLGAGVVAAVGVGLYLRKHGFGSSTATQPSSTGTPATDSSGGASGGASGQGTTPDLTPVSDLASSIAGLVPFLGAGTTTNNFYGTDPTGSPAAPVLSSPATLAPAADLTPVSGAGTYLTSTQPGTIYTDRYGNTVALQPSGVFEPAYVGPSGSYVSPATYAGLGVAPAPITEAQVAPPAPVAQQQIPAPPQAFSSVILPSAPVAAKKPAAKQTGGPSGSQAVKSGRSKVNFQARRQL